MYYSLMSIFLIFASNNGVFTDIEYDTDLINDSDISPDEIDTGGLFGTGISFSRFSSLLAFGVGLPEDTPSWMVTMFGFWQSGFLLFSIGWLISSIWNG